MNEKLNLMRPDNVSLKQGESSIVPLMVLRDNMDDSVILKLEDLPDGLEVVNDCAVHRGHLRSSVEIRAKESACPVADHEARVVAIGRCGEISSQPVHIAIQKCEGAFPTAERVHPVLSIEEELGREPAEDVPVGRPLGEYARRDDDPGHLMDPSQSRDEDYNPSRDTTIIDTRSAEERFDTLDDDACGGCER